MTDVRQLKRGKDKNRYGHDDLSLFGDQLD